MTRGDTREALLLAGALANWNRQSGADESEEAFDCAFSKLVPSKRGEAPIQKS
jgi:hypothetical protein